MFFTVYSGRTQSAPLPLGHPMLQGGMIAPPTHYEEYLAEKQLHDQQQAHNYLKQQIRQTVLTRVGSRGSQANQLDEASESEESEVIDLTGKKDLPEESEISKQQRDREQFLQQQRDLMMRHTLQVSETPSYIGSRSPQSARPLSRALSSPLVHLGMLGTAADTHSRCYSLSLCRDSAHTFSRRWVLCESCIRVRAIETENDTSRIIRLVWYKDLRAAVGTSLPVARRIVRQRGWPTIRSCWNTPVFAERLPGDTLNMVADYRAYGRDFPKPGCCNVAIVLDRGRPLLRKFKLVTARLMHSCLVRIYIFSKF